MATPNQPSDPRSDTQANNPNRAGCSLTADGRKTALVTGSGKRLGREIALGLAAAGWDIVVHYHHSAADAQQTVDKIISTGQRAIAIQADLSDPKAVDALFDQSAADGSLRAIVNNASHFVHDAPNSFAPEHLQAHLGPNLMAPVQLAQRLHAWLPEPSRGAVVNILDQKLESLNPDFFSYTLTKQALLGATKMMAIGFAPKIRVVGVSPGLTLPSYIQTEADFAASHRATALLDTSSTATDIVNTVVFLLDSPAITGVNLTVDGGQHLLGLTRDVSFINSDNL